MCANTYVAEHLFRRYVPCRKYVTLQHPKNNLFTLKKLILIENKEGANREIRAFLFWAGPSASCILLPCGCSQKHFSQSTPLCFQSLALCRPDKRHECRPPCTPLPQLLHTGIRRVHPSHVVCCTRVCNVLHSRVYFPTPIFAFCSTRVLRKFQVLGKIFPST